MLSPHGFYSQDAFSLPSRSPKRPKRASIRKVFNHSAGTCTHRDDFQVALSVPKTIHDRVLFYELSFERFIQKDSQLKAWIRRSKQRGPPQVMKEGYCPPRRVSKLQEHAAKSRVRPEAMTGSVVSSVSSSLSTLLRKATPKSSNARPPSTAVKPVLQQPPKPSASRFFTASLSRLSLSRSTQPSHVKSTSSTAPSVNLNKKNAKSSPPPPSLRQRFIKRTSAVQPATRTTDIRNTSNPPIPVTRPKSSPPPPKDVSYSSVFLDHLRKKTGSNDSFHEHQQLQPANNGQERDYQSTKSQIDPTLLNHYLRKTEGDLMVAMSMALKERKRWTATPIHNHPAMLPKSHLPLKGRTSTLA
ncbi:uncharacterized protein BYT42DRAFT_552890 [Radiomyces spectabilis]|uniref:uncharacterized protein n=1 Tax=Radiomyces spectabilis TaxID=64574 RepID=UPI002220AF05|nr:uncharacterized protein BYT42DRAFT_552890 [Radiomyces spectabilis]KAI8393963.1 hypothetical protein BYT42DRAFT_552890 [Radiomyces spectabilis]